MSDPAVSTNPLAGLPDGYTAVPLDPRFADAPVRPCVITRDEPDPTNGQVVVLRSIAFGKTLLGAAVDAEGRLLEWLELWLFDPSAGPDQPPAVQASDVTNSDAEAAWQRARDAARALTPHLVVDIGTESVHPSPTVLRRDPVRVEGLTDPASNAPLALCTDEAALAGAGLPGYATSNHRYLWTSGGGDAPSFFPVTASAPTNERTAPLDAVLQPLSDAVPFNPGGGFIHVYRYLPASLDEVLRVLEGETWAGVLHGRTVLPVGDELHRISQSATTAPVLGGHMLLARRGVEARLAEILHLKLRALADVIESVARTVETGQTPLLNLTLDSFRVNLPTPAPGLPYLWGARTVLAAPGDAIRLAVPAADHAYFRSPSTATPSVFRPASGQHAPRGQAALRIRQVIDQGSGEIVLDGTLSTPEPITLDEHDLLWLRLPTRTAPTDLFVSLQPDQSLAAGEARFRSLPHRYSAEAAQEIKALEGVPLSGVSFEVVPLRSSPCDLYSIAVVAVRTFATDQQQSLAVAIDQILRLARAADQHADRDAPLADRLRQIFADDEQWLESLGPHRLIAQELDAVDGLQGVPLTLWLEALELVMRLFPGACRESFCADLGDAPPAGLQRVFEPVAQAVEHLLVCSRSLIVVDWHANREIHSVVRAHATGLAKSGARG